MAIGDKILALRKQQGWSQQENKGAFILDTQ